jgi:GT2 family glycosyltransferase
MASARVVILNWNGREVLPRFLPSVVASTPPKITVGGIEVTIGVVVVDNGSTDGSAELLRRDFPSVRLVSLDRNTGFAGGYNRGIAAMEAADEDRLPTADYLILLNSDMETPAGWLEPLVEMLVVRPDVAAVAPKVLSWAERDMFEYAGAAGGFIDFLGYPFCRGRILGAVERDGGQYDDAREVFWATGACLACRADVFRDAGGFDERFFAHQEELDLCWRMQSAGWKVMVEPLSKVYHLGAGTLPPSPQKLFYNYRNNLAMLYKNLPSGTMQAVVAARMALNVLAATVYLVRGERENFSAVRRAHRDFRRMRRDYLRDVRRQVQATRIARPAGIYRGSILLNYLFGKRRFSELKIG